MVTRKNEKPVSDIVPSIRSRGMGVWEEKKTNKQTKYSSVSMVIFPIPCLVLGFLKQHLWEVY